METLFNNQISLNLRSLNRSNQVNDTDFNLRPKEAFSDRLENRFVIL